MRSELPLFQIDLPAKHTKQREKKKIIAILRNEPFELANFATIEDFVAIEPFECGLTQFFASFRVFRGQIGLK